MRGYRFLDGLATLQLNRTLCVGCGNCTHRISTLNTDGLDVRDRDLYMKCEACVRTCPTGALHVTPRVGCAIAILGAWINRLFCQKIFSDCC